MFASRLFWAVGPTPFDFRSRRQLTSYLFLSPSSYSSTSPSYTTAPTRQEEATCPTNHRANKADQLAPTTTLLSTLTHNDSNRGGRLKRRVLSREGCPGGAYWLDDRSRSLTLGRLVYNVCISDDQGPRTVMELLSGCYNTVRNSDTHLSSPDPDGRLASFASK